LNFTFTEKQIKKLSTLLDWPIQNVTLFEEAFLHPSCSYLKATNGRNYQRLEFLGDRVLGLLMSETLIKLFPNEPEGKIARRFTALVCMDMLAEISQKLQLAQFLFVLPGVSEEALKNSASSLADVVESVIAALYLDAGLEKTRTFIEKHWMSYIQGHTSPPKDPKSALQEWLQAQGSPLPSYDLIETKGPLHNPIFVVEVKGEGFLPAQGEGNSKKVAEHKAAQQVLNILEKIIKENN
jgi:ribonuclease III